MLHGLYYHREIVGEALKYSAAEINWLVHTRIPRTRLWVDAEGKLKSKEVSGDDYLMSIGATSAQSTRPLAYLEEAGFIKYGRMAGVFKIQVTAKGAEIARQLDSWMGRRELWYSEHRDGVLGLLLTIAVSVITAWVTATIVGR